MFTWTQIMCVPDQNKNASRKHSSWKILVQHGPFEKTFHSKREGWFMPFLIPNLFMSSCLSTSVRHQHVSAFKAVSCFFDEQQTCQRQSTTALHKYVHRHSSRTHKRGGEWSVWCTAVRRVEEGYLETCSNNGICLQHSKKHTFFFYFCYFGKIAQLCANKMIYSDSRLGASLCSASMFAVKFRCLITMILIWWRQYCTCAHSLCLDFDQT